MSARKSQEPIIVIGYGNKIAGWIGIPGGRLMGDKDIVRAARLAAAENMDVSLYQDIFTAKAKIDDPKNLVGVFAAFAAYDKERIRLLKAPESLWDSLGLTKNDENPSQPIISTTTYVIDGEKYKVPNV